MADQNKTIVYQEAQCYVVGADEAYLVGSKCRYCGYVAFPPRLDCCACVSKETMAKLALGSRGRIDTYSIVHTGTKGFPAPYVLAYVLIGEAKVLTLVTGCEPREDALEIGQEVELVIEKLREDAEGNEIRGYKFRPVGAAERKDGVRCAR